MDKTSGHKAPATAGSSSGISYGGLALDRKKMEEERLARLKRRAAPDDDNDALQTQEPPRQKPRTSQATTPAAPAAALQSQPAPVQIAAGPPYLSGAVRRTWARGYPRQADDITIDEILQRDKLELAMISSYQWEEVWMLSKIDIRRTRLLLVAFAASESTKKEMKENAPPNTRFCFPPMLDRGAMHSKLQILKFGSHLRLVIPTGNMTAYDWGETGVMENMVFVIDLPRLDDPNEFIPTGFTTELCRYLTAMGLDEGLINSLPYFDFTQTTNLAFVHTIAGKHKGDAWRQTGYCGLGTAISSLGLATENTLNIDFVCASIGCLNESFLAAMYYACQGDSGLKELSRRSSKQKSDGAGDVSALFKETFRIYFPSEEMISKTRGGKRSAGTICFQRSWWNSAKFPRELMRDSSSTRPGLLVHTKAILARKEGASRKDPHRGWAYVGSANLSASAWGKLVKDKQTGEERLDCRNWECGVVLPADYASKPDDGDDGLTKNAETEIGSDAQEQGHGGSSSNTSSKGDYDHDDGMSMFADTLPMPIKFPGPRYTSSGPGSHPWFFHD